MSARSVFRLLSFWLALTPSLLLGAEPPRLDRYGDALPPHAIARLGTARLRIDRGLCAFGFWPNDQTLAACCSDGSMRFWERATGRQIRRLQTPLTDISAAVFIPTTKAVALVGDEKEFLLWDSDSGKAHWKTRVPDYGGGHNSLAVSPDGKLLALPEKENQVSLYETTSGRKLRSLEEAGCITLVFSPDSTHLAIASRGAPVHLWDVRTGKKVRDLPSPENLFSRDAIAFSHDGKMVVVGSDRGAIVLETATGKEVSKIQSRYHITRSGLLFTADGKTLITGHYPGEVHFWDPATGKERFARKTDWDQGAWPVLSRDGKVLAVGDREGREYRFIRLLDPATGKDVGPLAEGHETQLNFVGFSHDGKMLLSSDRRTFREWKTETGEPTKQSRRFLISDEAPAFSADQKLLALPSIGIVNIYEMGLEKPIRSLEYKGKDVIRAVAFSPDGKYLLSAHNHFSPPFGVGKNEGEDGLHFWDLSTGKEMRNSHTSAEALYSQLVITADGRTAIAGSVTGRVSREDWGTSTHERSEGAGQLYLWDLPSGRALRQLEGHKGAILLLALSRDGRLLASGSADHTFRLWELASGKTLFTLPAGKTHLAVATLSPDGRLLATGGGADRGDPFSICLYSTESGKLVLRLRGANSQVNCLAFSPDNRRLASGFSDGTALVWDVSDACLAVRPVARQLTAKERETLWADLADADALKAHRAIGTLIAGGNDAVDMLKARLRPAERVDPKRLQKLLSDLDADEFAVREAASSGLAELGERVETALETALRNRPSLEARKRIEHLLVRARSREWSLEQLRAMRAVRVLEQIGSVEARDALLALTKGNADALLTREVKASLTRLKPPSSKPERRP